MVGGMPKFDDVERQEASVTWWGGLHASGREWGAQVGGRCWGGAFTPL